MVGKRREKEKIKIIIPFRSVPTQHVIQNSKKIAKKFKKLSNTIMASIHAKNRWKTQRKRENKNFHSGPFRSVSTLRVIENSKKIAKKFKKLNNTIMASF